jgi:hypothetical protein
LRGKIPFALRDQGRTANPWHAIQKGVGWLQAKEFAQRFGTDRSHPRTIPFGRTLLAHLVTFRRKFSLAQRSPFTVWRLAFGVWRRTNLRVRFNVDPLKTLELPSGRDAHSQTTPRWRRSAVSECLILPPVVYSPIYLLGSPLGRRRSRAA